MKNLKKKTAFSLVELSIVLLIVGLVIAAISKGSAIFAYNKLINARTITNSSPLSSIPDLELWYDTVSENSFYESNLLQSSPRILTWRDINPFFRDRNNTFQIYGKSGPTYTTNCLNFLPCLRFSGTEMLALNAPFFKGTEYTIFVVEQRRSADFFQYIFHGEGVGVTLTYEYNANFGWFNGSDYNSVYIGVPGYSIPYPRIIVARMYNGSRQSLSVNGATAYDNDNGFSYLSDQTRPWEIGNNYIGDLYEIIIFTRGLTDEEKRSVEVYLGKKWGIAIS